MTGLPRVLLVEDNPDEIRLARVAFSRCAQQVNLQVATDGRQALDLAHAGPDLPRLMLLDINIPIIDGFGVLEALRDDARLAAIPVVVLTSSTRSSDLVRAQSLGARAVYTKATDFPAFTATIAAVLAQFLSGD